MRRVRRANMVMASLITLVMPGWPLSVSPAHTEVRLPAGGTSTAVITVLNPHAEAYDVDLSEKPWFIYPENRAIQVENWLKLPSKKHFRLKPGKSRDVTITIFCPKEARGELMGMVSFAYRGMQPGMVTPMISTAVYLDVIGTENMQGEIVALAAGTRQGRFQTGVQVKAAGNVRLRPSGRLRLQNDQGQVMGEYVVGEANPLFPGAQKDYVGKGPENPPPAGHYKLSADLVSGTLELKAERGLMISANGDVQLDPPETAVPVVNKEAPKP